MSGGGGDAPPPSSSVNSGEFILRLLRNPPQQPRQQAQQRPAQNLPHDPAVAAVGPSISFPPPLYQSNVPSGHEHLSHRSPWSQSPTHFAPHNFFLQNPNPNLNSASPPRPGFDQTYQQNYQLNQSNLFGGDDVKKVGSFGTNPKLNSAHQQVQTNFMFGSLPFDIHNNVGVSSSNDNQLRRDDRVGLLGNRIQNGLEKEFQKSLELNQNKELNAHAFGDHGGGGGSNRWVETPVRCPPPGFSSNPSVGNKSGSFEQNRSKGKGKFGELNHRNVTSVTEEEKGRAMSGRMSGERSLIGQLFRPGLPAGSNLHSVTTPEFEESLLELHGEVRGDLMRRKGDQVQTELEDLDERVMGTLDLVDESAEKSVKKKRDKVNGFAHTIFAY